MASDKERIEALEARLGEVQRLEFGINDKMQHLDEAINKLSEVPLTTTITDEKDPSVHREGSFYSIHTMRTMTAANKFSLPKWKNWNSRNTLDKIRLYGSTEKLNSLNFKAQQITKRYLSLLSTLKEKLTNGGSGCVELIGRKAAW